MRHLVATALFASTICCAPAADMPEERTARTSDALDAVAGFGQNPGNLLMFRYAPASAPRNAPLVAVLHGCTQTAADIANAGFNALADQYGFYVVYPQQQSANNPAQCFNWFGQYNNPANKVNVTRGQGEDESIKEMVDKMKADFSIDPTRVFVVGFSAGAAMAAAVLATWPDVFAAGGIDAGVPYGCPSTSNIDVFMCMNPGKTQAADVWGQAVKQGYAGWTGPWPRVSIWQGTQDFTVSTTNEQELVKEWTSVHALPQTPTTQETVDGYPHAVFSDAHGAAQVESWQITGMGHGIAVDPSHGCGTAGSYVLDEHECTALRMVQFFGIASSSHGGGGGGGAGGWGGGAGGGGNGAPGASPGAGSSSSGCGVARSGGSGGVPLVVAVLALLVPLLRRRRAA